MPTEEQPRQIGAYEVLNELGGSGRVFKATDTTSGRVVAIKIAPPDYASDPEKVEEFQRGAEAVAKVNHPNVVRVLDQGEDGGVPYVVMECVEGDTLESVMKHRRLTLQEALSVFKAVCKGLEAAHREQIVHRGLHPGNILVSEDLRVVKLADFGLGKAEALSEKLDSLATGQVNMGSLHYMSPEQASRTADVDHRTDIYSAGVLFYELLTGRVPVGRFSLPSQLNNEVPPEVDPVILRCLETRAVDRFQTAAQLLQALGQIEDHLRLGLMEELQGFSSSTSKILLRSTGKMLGGKAPIVLAGLLGLVVIVVLVVLLRSGDGDKPAPPAPAAVPTSEEAAAGDSSSEGSAETTAPLAEEADSSDGTPDGIEEPVDEVAEESPEPEEPDLSEPAASPVAEANATRPQPSAAVPPPAATGPTEAERAAAARAAQANEDLRVAMDKFAAALYDPALADLQDFISRYGDHPRLPEVYLTVGKAHEQKSAVQQALAAYVEVQSRFPRTPSAVEAQYRQADLTARQRGRQSEARELLAEFVRAHPQSAFAPTALASKASVEKEEKIEVTDPGLGKVPAALQSWQALVDTYPKDPATERAYWELAQMWDELRQYQRSAESYAELGRRFPKTTYDAWWEAGQMYDRRLNDRIRAIAAYENVPQSSNHYRDAQKRIQRLN